MEVPYKSFLRVAKQTAALSKYVKTMDVSFSTFNECVDGKYIPNCRAFYSNLCFDSVANMHGYCQQLPIPTTKLRIDGAMDPAIQIDGGEYQKLLAKIIECGGWADTNTAQPLGLESVKHEPTITLIPESLTLKFKPQIIKKNPIEYTEGDFTYRILTNQNSKRVATRIAIIARNDEPIYDYLDRGFLFMTARDKDNDNKPIHIVSNSYDINTSHIFVMCKLQSNLTELLRDGCFIDKYEAELLKLKMIKKLTAENKNKYLAEAAALDTDYRKNTTLIVVDKLIKKEIEKTTIRDVVFSATAAKYENTEIEAENLLAMLSSQLNFNGEFDIYTIIQMYAKYVEVQLNRMTWSRQELTAIEEGNTELKKKSIPTFKINGISISAAVTPSGQRYLNNIRINLDEVVKAIHRASCYRSAEDYDLFLKSISRMSIKRHDIVANGLQVKIHSNITHREYDNSEPAANAPAIKFIVDKKDKRIKLYVDENRQVAVDISKLIKKVESINKRTNNRGSYNYVGRYTNRDYLWAASELADALIECTTFPVKVKDPENGTESVVDTVLISREDVIKLLKVVDEQNKAKIERSKQFLSTAIKLTGAEEIEFLGQKAYKVKGGLREYAVLISNAKVYDYATKQYRCIVNDRHYAGAGYDDIASRLLALKNDSVMQQHIRTLEGQAQPNAENAHADYRPERDVQDIVTPLVDKAFEKI